MIVHLPEYPLRSGSFGGLGRVLGIRVGGADWKVAEDIAKLVFESLFKVPHNRVSLAAVRTLVIAVLDKDHRRVNRALTVVSLAERRREFWGRN
jgi:hypothetical protein